MGESMPVEIDQQTLEWTKFQLSKMGEPVKLRVFDREGSG